jgi:hypothetical protein
MSGKYEGGSRLTWTSFFPEDGTRKIKHFYGQLVATLHSLPGRWPCVSLLGNSANAG